MKLLVLGATGLLGTSLTPTLQRLGHEVISHGLTHGAGSAADLSDAAQTDRLFAEVQPEAAINLAGLTNVDLCETQHQQAWRANVLAVEHVAAACRMTGARLVHLSTDHVYDGDGPSTEEQARPGNYYALTKYAGELAARAAGATVLRVNFFGASRHPTRRSLTDWLWSSLTSGQRITVFDDVRFSPLSIPTLSLMIDKMVSLGAQGIFNTGSNEGMSKADFAYAFARSLGLPTDRMTRASIDLAPPRAWRPRDMRMCNARLEKLLGLAMPCLEGEIDLAAKDYRDSF